MIRILVPGQPQGKARPRFAQGRTYTPAKTVAYEGLIAYAGQEVMRGKALIEGPVYLTVTATFDIPKSWSKKRRLEASAGMAWHTSRPDYDNILKAAGDALNGIVWKDDSQVALAKCVKLYGEKPGLDIMVEELA